MPHSRTSCHSAEILEVISPHELVCLEVFRQSPVYFFVGRLREVQSAFQAFDFQYAELILQCLVGTKQNRFQFYFGRLSFRVNRYRFRTGQAGAEVADAVQMYLLPVRPTLVP